MTGKKQRGAVRAEHAEFIGAWIPKPLVALLDKAVRERDTDRSKFIRAAMREKLEAAR